MPEVMVEIQYEGKEEKESFYSPSTCMFDFFEEGSIYPLEDFKRLMLEALKEANKRVIEKFGFGCFGCDMQIRKARNLKPLDDAKEVKVLKMYQL